MDEHSWPGPVAVLDNLSDEIRGRIKSELDPGERLLWAARAIPQPFAFSEGYRIGSLVAAGLYTLSGCLLAAYFGALGRSLANIQGLSGWGVTLGVVGSLVVLGIVAGWLSDREERHETARTIYALTDRRAIIWKPRADSDGVAVHSIEAGTLVSINRVEYPDGLGDVEFTYRKENSDLGLPHEIKSIFEVRRVEELARGVLIGPGPAAS